LLKGWTAFGDLPDGWIGLIRFGNFSSAKNVAARLDRPIQ
jgi:hypothetical protein